MKRWLWLFLLPVCFSVPVFAADLQTAVWEVPSNLPEYRVIEALDGDTIRVEKIGKIRYIGINAPEIHYPAKKVQPYGLESYLANRRLVEGKKVCLQLDAQERDKYGRILAYVYVEKIFVNAYLVESGYARVMTVPPNVQFQDLFLKLQREARKNKRGLWAGQRH